MISMDKVRSEEPHVQLEDIEPWNYNIDWAGGRSNWFDDINYTDLPLDQQLPQDLLDQLNNTLFLVRPADPAQLWRGTAYDLYDGSGWSKSLSGGTFSLSPISRASAANQIYTISMNVSVSANVEPIELPSLFPEIQVIEDSFRTIPADALIDYYLETDEYDTLLLYPFLAGNLGDTVLLEYDISYVDQDLATIEANALHGSAAEAGIATDYGRSATTVELSSIVLDEIAPFRSDTATAYEQAMAVDLYFKTNYELMMNESQINERPDGQEVTEWLIERGGGLPMDFATAYSVFMRELDIPARMTIGYAMGDPNPDGSDSRLVKVLHMMFWVEVFIPTSTTDGEWIQVIPVPLPSDFGGGDLPQNTGASNVTILVGTPENIALQLIDPTSPLIPQWSMIGDPFNLSAMVLVNGQPYVGSEPIRFYDLTDGVEIGTTPIQFTPDGQHLPLANITYAFPDGSTVGAHNISAMWITSTFLATGYTSWAAVGQSSPSVPVQPFTFTPSETIQMDIKLGLNNYTAQWVDTLHVFGVMTIGGSPANGTRLAELGNDQMWIMWDGLWYANATIGPDGYYEYYIYLDPTDLVRMTAGQHNVSAFYAGATDPETGIPVVLAGSSDNSTVTLSAVVGFDLTVTPTTSYGGGTITYDGNLYLLNGTQLVGETVGILFDGAVVDTTITNGTGGFNYGYVIPLAQSSGDYLAQVNFTSTIPLVNGNTSLPVTVTVESGATTLTIDSTPKDPQAVHTYENITIFGTLTVTSDGTPLGGRVVDIYWDWNNGTVQLLGSNTTDAVGYYTFTYQIPAYSEGLATYWTEFSSLEPNYQSSASPMMNITVKRYDVIVSIETIQSSVVIGETLDIQGTVYLPEIPALLGGVSVDLWWDNGSIYNIATVVTNTGTGIYIFNYTVPITHPLQTVSLWANYTSTSPALYSNESVHLPIVVRNYDSYISVNANSSVIHLNETVYIYGYLEHENGTPLTGMLVTITWNNGTDYNFQAYTNATGWYNFYYNCSLSQDSEGTVTVTVAHVSVDITYSGSTAILSPSLTLQLYQLTITSSVNPNPVHLDESFIFDGVLTFDVNGKPLAGATILIFYQYENGTTYSLPKVTNSTGGFLFQYNCSLSDTIGAIYVWGQYISSDPLWDNATSLTHTVNLILYSMTLTTFTNSTSYFIDEAVFIWGRLTYSHNGTPLDNQPITIYWLDTGLQTLGPVYTNSTGYFNYTYQLMPGVDPEGSVTVWAAFNTTVPLWDNASSTPGVTFSVTRYAVTIDITVTPNPVYLNETLTIQAHAYFTHNGSDVAWILLSFYWNNGTVHLLGSYTTDLTGWTQFTYSGMDNDSVWTSIDVYATFSGNLLLSSAESNHVSLTLQQWATLFVNVGTGGITSYKLGETVVITGLFYYDVVGPDIPYGSATIEVLVDGTPVNTTITISDGSFTGYWTIPIDTTTGSHDITVRFTSPVNWIAGTTYSPAISLTIDAVNIIWTFDATPDPVYRGEWLYISGTLDLDNGSVYAGATVTIYWQSPSQSIPSEIAVRVTDGSGFFELWYQVSDTAELGLTTILVDCSSGTPVIAYSTATDLVTVELIPVVLIGSGSVTDTIYLGDTIDFSGTLTFGNGTPMVGYEVSIIWDYSVLATITIEDAVTGSFSYSYLLPWDESVRNITYFIEFNRPSEAYQESQTNDTYLEIRDTVAITLDSQTVDVVFRGDLLTISGTVTNGGGADGGVPIEVLIDGAPSGQYDVTDSEGRFSVDLLIRNSISPDLHNFTVSINSAYYDVSSAPAYWEVEVHITSTITIAFDDLSDVVPTQQFTISFTVIDEDGNTPVGDYVSVYLNDTYITDLRISDGLNTWSITLPSSWSGGSGYFIAVVEWDGSTYVEGAVGETDDSIHVYDSAEFTSFGPPYAAVNSRVRLTGQLIDGAGNPIVGATIRLYLNRTPSPGGISATVTTDASGVFSYILPSQFTETGSYFFVAEFVMGDGTLVTGRHDFEITLGAPPGFDTALLITWVVAIGIELFIAMVIIARYRYNRGSSRLFGFRLRSRSSDIYDSLVR